MQRSKELDGQVRSGEHDIQGTSSGTGSCLVSADGVVAADELVGVVVTVGTFGTIGGGGGHRSGGGGASEAALGVGFGC